MYASKVVTDSWNGPANSEHEHHLKSCEQIDHAIGHLDQKVHTLVIVESNSGAHLAVGGGLGRYIVYATFDNETYFNLVKEPSSGETVSLFVGGQHGDYPLDTVIDKESAISAARTFAFSGELDSGQKWQEA